MPRRSRNHGSSAGARHQRRAAQTTQARKQIEETLDALEDALLAGDTVRVQTMIDEVQALPPESADVIVRRLEHGQAKAPGLALTILGAIAGERAEQQFRRVYRSRSVDDSVRIEARRLAGWEPGRATKERLAFLAALRDGDAALASLAELGIASWPVRLGPLEEFLTYVAVLPADRRLQVVTRVVGAADAGGLPLLHALLHVADPAVQEVMIDAVAGHHAHLSAAPLTRLARTALDPAIRERAAAAAGRGHLSPVGAEGDAWAEPMELPPVVVATLTAIDGSGSQSCHVARQTGDETCIYINVFFTEQHGIRDCFGVDMLPMELLDETIALYEDEDVPLVDVDIAAIRGALALAAERNALSGVPIPPSFELWAPLLHDRYPPAGDEPLDLPALDDAPFRDRQDLVKRSDTLLDNAMFVAWGFEPDDVTDAMFDVDPPKQGRWTDRQYVPMIEELVTPVTRAQLCRQLRRQAWLLDIEGEPEARDIALAVAASLRGAGPSELTAHPFLRRMLRDSVDRVASEPFGLGPAFLPPIDPQALQDAFANLHLIDVDGDFDEDDVDDEDEAPRR